MPNLFTSPNAPAGYPAVMPTGNSLAVTVASSLRHRPIGLLAALLVAPVFLGACASGVPVPTEQLATARTAVTSAANAGAADLAPTELRLARDKLTQANVAVADKNNEHATYLARESQADANLAEVKARSVKAQKAAGELAEGNRVLREELQRSAQ